MTVRQVFYQATVRGNRREGRDRLRQGADRSHGDAPGARCCPMTGSPTTPAGNASRARSTASRTRSGIPRVLSQGALERGRFLRRDLAREGCALAGVVYPVTSTYDVPLMVARGYASLSFLYSAAEAINELDVTVLRERLHNRGALGL